jgi:radical SAM superfamily enzyme YgiQ (UPF0313 family)
MAETDPSGRTIQRTILLVQAVDYDTRTLVGFQPLCTPLSIATIAALTPVGFIVDLWDENLEGLIDEATRLPRPHYDIVGISTLFEHISHRVPGLAALFRARGSYICAGGPGISNQLKMIAACVDSMFLNEAEYTWPQFLEEWSAGHPKQEYVQIAKPDMRHSPPPRWDSIADRLPRYRAGGVQTTRGCPFDCEFCDVIYLYGRAQRHKPVEHVLAEVTELQRLGVKRVFFTDDEFVGDPRYTRSLLQQLVPLNNSFPRPLAYHTQLTLNLSRHEDLLEYLADANFWHVLIGIESFSEEALRETNKLQNCNRDIVADCRKILSYGIGINGSLIVGFDHDGPEVFDKIIDGIRRACVPFASASILRATYGTKLWTRLRESKRLWKLRSADTFPQSLQIDILPGGQLTRAQLIEGRIYLNKELSKVSNLCERLHGWISLVDRVPRVNDPQQLSLDDAVRIIREHEALSLIPGDLRMLEEVLEHAREHAPVMIGRILDSILAQLYWYRIRTYHTADELRAVLEAEQVGDLVPNTGPILFPSAFATAFRKRLLALVYERLARNLPDPQLIPEAASEVFVDFLVRLVDRADSTEQTFTEPWQEEFLRTLCDRTVARLTGCPPESFVAATDKGETPLHGLKKTGLYDAVLKEVGDRFSRLNA